MFNLKTKLYTVNIAILAVFMTILVVGGLILPSEGNTFVADENLESYAISGNNTLLPVINPTKPEPEVVDKMPSIVTAYSSTPGQTDSTPFITASNTRVREGIIANNYLPFGTKVKIPEVYGDRIFVVQDRMNWRKSNYHFDIWFPNYNQAKEFGAKRTYIEILEN